MVQTVSEQDIKLQPLWHEDNGPGSRHQGQDRNQGQNRYTIACLTFWYIVNLYGDMCLSSLRTTKFLCQTISLQFLPVAVQSKFLYMVLHIAQSNQIILKIDAKKLGN